MDHLPTPLNPCLDSQVEVPYFCRKDFQPNQGSVFSYPASRGYDQENYLSTLEITPETHQGFEGFLQEWLYFVFLYQVFHAVGVEIDHQDFVRIRSDGRRVLATSKLPEYIQQWDVINVRASSAEKAHS
jgi:hypothetical protein